MSLPPLLTPEEVADFLKKPRKYVLNLARSGKLQAYRVGREYRFSEGHLVAYLGSTTMATKRSHARAGSTVTTTGTLTEREIDARADRFFERASQKTRQNYTLHSHEMLYIRRW